MQNPFEQLFEKLAQIENKLNNAPQIIPDAVPEILTTSELCKRLAISEPTVIKLRKQRKIPFLKFGNVIRYNWPNVIKALENSKKKQ